MYTVLCAFEDRETARRSITRMIRHGLPRDDIHVQLEPAEYAIVHVEHEGTTASRWAFLARLFRAPSPPGAAGTYRDAVRRGSTVVVVHVADADEAEDAARLMAGSGAFDVEQCRRAGKLDSTS